MYVKERDVAQLFSERDPQITILGGATEFCDLKSWEAGQVPEPHHVLGCITNALQGSALIRML